MSCGETSQTCGCGGGGHDERHAPVAPYNPPGRTALDYRVGTYPSFRAAMLDRLASPAYPALRGLTVRTTDDPAIGLLDAWAVLGDLLTFHSERIADEGYLRTANEHRSLTLLGRLVGYQGRPGVSAGTWLAYTVDRDPRTDEDTEVFIPRGSRSHSVPAGAEAERAGEAGGQAQTFETDADLTARADWNELAVRRRRPAPLVPDSLRERSELFVEGTANSLGAGDQLLFVFGGGTHRLLPVESTRIDREEGVTALRLPDAPPPSIAELVEEVRRWITEQPVESDPTGRATEDGDDAPAPTPENPNPRPVSGLIEDFDEQVLAALRADLDEVGTYERLVEGLVAPRERLAEARALAAPYPQVAAWFERLAGTLAEVSRRAGALGCVPEREAAEAGEQDRRGQPEGAEAAVRALGALLPALRPPSRARGRRGGQLLAGRSPFGDGSALVGQLPAALGQISGADLHRAWRQAGPTDTPTAPGEPELLRELLALRVRAAPFGSTAPLQPVQDAHGRSIRLSDWPLRGAALTTVRVVYDTAGGTPLRAEFVHAHAGAAEQHAANLPATEVFELGPGSVDLSSAGGDEFADTVAHLLPGLPNRTVTFAHPGAGGQVRVTVDSDDVGPVQWTLSPGDEESLTHGELELRARYTTRSEPAAVEVSLGTAPDPRTRHVLPLDSAHSQIAVGSRVVVERPGKGEDGPDGIPGDPALALVVSRVTRVRTVSYAEYGITGRGTQLTLVDPWLDEQDTLLSHIRGAVVHAAGEELHLADEPLGTEVHGNRVKLADLYEGLRPGRSIAVTGARADVPPRAEGVAGAEPAVIAAVDHVVDPDLPGDRVHTVLTLTSDLVHRYRRDTVRVWGNVVAASHGESREEAIGSGDTSRPHQSFALWQSPLTWLPDDVPLGATPTLEVRVDGLLWRRVDSLAGRGPTERVYVLGADAESRVTVTFGDGRHGARLPTGHENVRARYRFGTGSAANVSAGRITQAVTRPLGVTAVTNPVPATGGADPDGPDLARKGGGLGSAAGLPPGRRRVPLTVSALDRLVSVADYEDFTRSRAGIGRASARELFDGRRRTLHLTVAGTEDVPLRDEHGEDSPVLRALRASLSEYGDPRLPVRVEVRELVVLLLAAKVKVKPEYSFALVEPRLRRALLRTLGFAGRDLGQATQLSEVLATAHTVPGVDWVDVDAFTGLPASASPVELLRIVRELGAPVGEAHAFGPRDAVPAALAAYAEEVHLVRREDGETLTSIAARYGIPLAELLRLNPDITDTRPLPRGRSVHVFRGIRPAQLALLAPRVPDTLILTEVHQ